VVDAQPSCRKKQFSLKKAPIGELDVFFLVGANTTFDVNEMFRKTVAVPLCDYWGAPIPDPIFTYQLLNMDGTALDPDVSSGIDITEYGGFLFTMSNF
jgi:hypothetical protein